MSEPRKHSLKPTPCSRCGGEMDLVTVIRKFGDQPSYKLFRCVACELVDWVPE
jgi:hypothetical protein